MPFRKVALPDSEQTTKIPRPPAPRPLPPRVPPPRQGPLARLGDIPIKVVYLIGAILVTVLAVVLVFVIFSGDVPKQAPSDRPSQVATASATPAPKPSAAQIALPAVPESMKLAPLPGKATVTDGVIADKATGLTYPRFAKPWQARSYPPFSVAQRIGKVAIPHTVIASAMLPGNEALKKPSTDADYRALAARAVRWTMRTQYPAGATLAWTGSQKLALGKGWLLGYKVTFTSGGAQHVAQALIAVVEVGKTKPAMLLASIPDSGKSHWPDLNVLAKGLRPL
ncbi:hypothetical protein ACIBHX_07730 [Nonomuraea sp. NPDC050536]|uniref:hypothetical protein n=1 Tax=Nonomuraea sp. NPDC050536 TaxID=3364366 RepID=UPI0037C62708